MKFVSSLVLGLLALTLAAPAAPQEKPAEKKAESRVLKVKLNYTGSSAVDAKHPIYVFLFDSPDFMQGNGMPIAAASATAKDETVTFDDLQTSPVYVVAAFDPEGKYDGQSGPPPAGSSMGMYFKEPGKPEPVKIDPGQTVQIDLPFDDSFKMQ